MINKKILLLIIVLGVVLVMTIALVIYSYNFNNKSTEVKTTPKVNVEPSRTIIPSEDPAVSVPTNIKPLPPVPPPPS